MATTSKNVLVIQDASKILNLRVLYWILNGLSLRQEDMVTVVAILHEIYTPMGYKITLDKGALAGGNQRIIEKELAKKKGEYLNHEELAHIAQLYESNKVVFKIKLFKGSSPRDVTIEVAKNLKATWVILDRKMKKDEEFLLQQLSCGISILRRNNRIARLRGPIHLPDEIQCSSHETYDESLPSIPYNFLFGIDVFPNSTFNDDEQNQIARRPYDKEGCSNITTNIDEKTCQTSPRHPSMDQTEINSNHMIDKTERDEQCQHQGKMQNMPHDMEGDTTIVIKNDQTTQEIACQLFQDEEKTNNFFHDEKWESRNRTKREEMIDQPKDDMLSQNESQTLSIANGIIFDGEQENSILENSMCTFCSVCKTGRPDIGQQKEFTYEELQAATEAFSLKNCLSESSQLFTFKGQLEGGLKLVVKQHKITNTQLREKMKAKIQTILKARHNNVIMLLGSSTFEHFLLTVYEYACNGSLDMYLSKEGRRPLTWIERKRVAIGLARGLKYLHDNNIVHCNIKSSSILLSHDFKPLIGDFGFGKELQLNSYKNKNKGNYEYIAPECLEKGKLSNKIDVYSFGVVILELITGRRTTDMTLEDKGLVEWARPLLKGKMYAQLVDPIIRNSYEEDHFSWLAQVTTQCLKKNPKERLSMKVVVSSLQGIADSELYHMTEDIAPAISDSRIVPDMDGSQGQTTTKADQLSLEEEKIESRIYGGEEKLRLIVEDNNFYMVCQRDSDKPSQIKQMENRSQGEDRRLGKMIMNDHIMDETAVGQLRDFEDQIQSTLYREEITAQKISNNMVCHKNGDKLSQDLEEGSSFAEMKIGLIPASISQMIDQTKADQPVQDKTQLQRSFGENLLDQRETLLENSKSSACSICKSKRLNIACPKDFTYDELLEATEGFSIQNSLSESEDGPTFKGLLERWAKIVVKKYQITTSHEEQVLKAEVQLLTSARHKNMVTLLGSCTNKSQLMIVYEQVCNSSLDQYLTRGSFQSLSWNQRLKVAMGTARGLQYLHGNNIIHGNIKPSNILLTHDLEPLIGDFSFGKMKLETKKFRKDKSTSNSGYTAPENLENGKLSKKTDVYSFGVVLLELITGRRAMDKLCGGKGLVEWARPLLGGKKYPKLLDHKISNSYEEEKLLWLVQVTEQCLRKNPRDRFTMNMVVSALQGIAESDECCDIEYSSPEKSYLTHDDPAMARTQGQMKADPVKKEQEWIDRNQYEDETILRLTVKTNHMIGQRNAGQLIQGGENVQRSPHDEMSRVTDISNDKIDQINSDQQIKLKENIKESFHIEEMGTGVHKKQNVSKDEKQMQGICDDDLLNGNEAKIILDSSKSSICSICKSRRPNSELQKKYTYEELLAATEGFSIKYSLSEGEYGPAFGGQVENNQEIVIKQHAFTSLQEQKALMSEFQVLINARHENVIMLLGSCIRLSQLLIVYEKACNGSLDKYLPRESGRSLTWGERVKIAIGVARGLKYLHENNIIHGRIKPSNIFLNHDFKPLVGDFALGKERCQLNSPYKHKSMRNCGYTAPECHEGGKLSTKADVYSFGVVLVELITGRLITDKIYEQKCLVECARQLLGGRKFLKLIDPEVGSSYDEQELLSLIHVTGNCLRKNPKDRFTMDMIVSLLPSVADSNNIHVKQDFSPEKSNVLDATNTKGEEKSPEKQDLGTENAEEVKRNHRELCEEEEEEEPMKEHLGTENNRKKNNITNSRDNNETKVCQECDNNSKSCESSEKTEEKERPSTNKYWEGCSSYSGAREFYHDGAQEYTVCEELFGWCDSI
ncbi:hypothetical protein Fmac_026672 [Flemingia macrophylla]|uniref:non-specific serine/threonine protein kinase n=1 Tax=Flemingia macrophylla TaxID=520843 RepID=A0ABD1LG35_9FABA